MAIVYVFVFLHLLMIIIFLFILNLMAKKISLMTLMEHLNHQLGVEMGILMILSCCLINTKVKQGIVWTFDEDVEMLKTEYNGQVYMIKKLINRDGEEKYFLLRDGNDSFFYDDLGMFESLVLAQNSI